MKYLPVAVAVDALIGIGAYAPMMLSPGPSGGSATSNSCTTQSSSTQTLTTGTSPASTVQGSFTYSPSSPIRVQSVEAEVYDQGAQGQLVTFAVTYENTGSSDVYYVAGCGSSLVASVSAGSGVIQKSSTGPVCLCAEATMALPSGGNRTATTPGCWSGYHFVLLGPGTVQVQLTLSWGPTQASPGNDTTTVNAQFTFQ